MNRDVYTYLPRAMQTSNRSVTLAVVFALVLFGIAVLVTGCPSVPTAGPSESNYREVLTRVKTNLDTQIKPSLVDMRDADLVSATPRHTEEWWNAKIGLVSDTATLVSDALSAGASSK